MPLYGRRIPYSPELQPRPQPKTYGYTDARTGRTVYVYAVQNDPYPSDIESVELVPDSFVRTREFDAACEKLWESMGVRR
jgi:hypothetical protein